MSTPYPLPSEFGNSRYYVGGNWAVDDEFWRPVNIPDGAKMMYVTLCGPGGNGGAGRTRTAGTGGGGGGSGGSGAMTTFRMPLTIWIPKILYLHTPGSGSTRPTQLSVYPHDASSSSAAQYKIAAASAGTAGGVGGAGAGGSAGNGGSAMGGVTATLARFGTWSAVVGQDGIIGGDDVGVVGGNIVWSAAGVFVSSGASGAGCTTTDFAGGDITGSGFTPSNIGGAATASGSDGASEVGPTPWFLGGSGGGSNNSGTGGAGGIGAPGCGGGGGGAGTTGGAGGRGGPGFALVSFG